MKIRDLTDKREILSILETDRLYAAYAIGDLSSGLFEQCRWTLAEDKHGAYVLAVSFNGLTPPSLFLMGASTALRALLGEWLTTHRAYFTMKQEHLSIVSDWYHLGHLRHMWRMWVNRGSFRPVSAAVKRLQDKDLNALNLLYSWGGARFFAPYQFEQGIYYAVESGGKLVAAAGTHVVAPEYGIAVVGNVFTHPDYRNRGYATACTSAVVAELLALGCEAVVLNVWQENTPAVRAYRKLGFDVHCPFIEAPGQRKSTIEHIMSRWLPNARNTCGQ